MSKHIAHDEASQAAAVQANGPLGRHAAEQALGAVIGGVAISLAYPISMILLTLAAAGYFAADEFPRSDLETLTTVTKIATWTVVFIAFLTLLHGVVALVTGLRRGQPLGLPIHAIGAGLGALFFSLLLVFSANQITKAMWKEEDRRELRRMRENRDRKDPPRTIREW
jgi:hypothetical protein